MAEQQSLNGWIGRHATLLSVLLVAFASLRIIGTYQVFSQTVDEPAHIAAGMEWLDQGRYHYEALHPPLARVAAALGPFLDGRHSQNNRGIWAEGQAILGRGPEYDRTLTLARLGILPFFWIACLVVYCWGQRYFNETVACFAVLIFSMLPPVLAHAGLATTDMALTAMLGAAFLSAVMWSERPGAYGSLQLGLTTALAVLSKFSALLFLPITVLAAGIGYLLSEKPSTKVLALQWRARLPWLALAAASTLLMVSAGYRFSITTVDLWQTRLSLPFVELFQGIRQLANYNQIGSSNYLLGRHSDAGWWYFYFVDLGLKTPLSVLGLVGAGLAQFRQPGLQRGWRLAAAFSGSILVASMFSHINIGIRHVLPVYLGFSLLAATSLFRLLEPGPRRRLTRWIAAALMLELTTSSFLSHPDYLAYFNPLAGAHPERILVDSDLDWGQDVKRLSQRLQQLGAQQLAFTPCMLVTPAAVGLPPMTVTDFLHPSPGWNAVRLTQLELLAAEVRAHDPQLRLWPEVIPPTERVGKGILLFRFPDRLPPAPPSLPTAHIYC